MALPRSKLASESESDDNDLPDIGPALPPHLANPSINTSSDDDSIPSEGPNPVRPSATSLPAPDFYGPALPPSLLQQQAASRPIVGPSLPPSGSVRDYALPSDDDDDDVIGPRPPPDGAGGDYDVALEFEKRAERMKKKLTNSVDDGKLKRAEWMLELPPELNKNFGLGPRSFLRQTPAPKGDRSGWTQTPNDEAGGSDGKNEEAAAADDALDKKVVQDLALEAYNKSMNQRTEEINKSAKREKSLMEIHQKNLKRKKKGEERKPQERRPFDRDEDLKVNSFDDARRKALIKKSRQLDDKFSGGKSQFL